MTRAPRRPSEDEIQRSVIRFLDFAVKRPDRYWHVPNGGGRGAPRIGKDGKRKAPVQAALLKGLGVQAGVSDLHFIWATGAQRQFPCYGVIEMKDHKGAETPEQVAFGKDVTACGHTYAVARSVEDVERILRSWQFPLHATLLPSGAFKRT